MRFVFLWLCAILFSGVVYGESDRDSLKVRLGAPRLNLGAPNFFLRLRFLSRNIFPRSTAVQMSCGPFV